MAVSEKNIPAHPQSIYNDPEARNIHQRIHAVMQAVKYIQKEDKKVNNQYTFVSHDAVVEKIRPALIENGIVLEVSVTSHEQDGNRCTVDLAVDLVNIDTPEDRVRTSCFGYGIDNQDKGPGKAISYAFKYCLLKAFCLETGDDPERDDVDYKAKNGNGNGSASKPNGNGQAPGKPNGNGNGKSQPTQPADAAHNDLIKHAKNQCAALLPAVNKKLGEASMPQFNEKTGEFEAFVINAWCSLNPDGALTESVIDRARKNPHGTIDWVVGLVEKREKEKAQREQNQAQQPDMF